MTFRYRPDVLEQLLRHGIRPTEHTRPELVRDFVRDLYKYEIRCLRDRQIRREFPKQDYAGLADALAPQLTRCSRCMRGNSCHDGRAHATGGRPPTGRGHTTSAWRARAHAPRTPGQTLQATALVHEAHSAPRRRRHTVARQTALRRHRRAIDAADLVERALRARGAQKRWAGLNRVSFSDSPRVFADPEAVLPALDDTLARLEQTIRQARDCGTAPFRRAGASKKRRTRSACRPPR